MIRATVVTWRKRQLRNASPRSMSFSPSGYRFHCSYSISFIHRSLVGCWTMNSISWWSSAMASGCSCRYRWVDQVVDPSLRSDTRLANRLGVQSQSWGVVASHRTPVAVAADGNMIRGPGHLPARSVSMKSRAEITRPAITGSASNAASPVIKRMSVRLASKSQSI